MADLRYGSDVIVDLLRQAGISHAALNPGATFRGLHDSLVHHGSPELVLCTTEGIAVAVAHGYAKATGRPMAVLLHDIVGLQAATMAVYNAWCDRVPMLLIGGAGPMAKSRRRPWIDWIHTASAQAELIRHAIKWDDQPHDLDSVPESFARAVLTASSAPAGPVYLCYDVDLQEQQLPAGHPPPSLAGYSAPTRPYAPPAELDALAELLRDAEHPVLLAGHVGEDPDSHARLVELAESLAAPVIDTGVRLAFPTEHPLNATSLADEVGQHADVLLVLDVDDLFGRLPVQVGTVLAPGTATVVHAGLGHLRIRGWSQDYQSLTPTRRHLTADPDTVVTGLLERLRAGPPATGRDERWRRTTTQVTTHRAARRLAASTAEADGAVARDRLLHELGRALSASGLTWVLGNGTNERDELALWNLDRARQYAGWHAGGGLGYGLGACIGVALGSPPGTVVVDVQADGDALFTPGALWTMAHLQLPVLVVVHNNRQYGNSVGHAAALGQLRGRPATTRHHATSLAQPAVDFAGLARSFGVWGAGPLDHPDQLRPALTAALQVVAGGAPALVDVLTPGL